MEKKEFDQSAYIAAYQKANLERHSLNLNRNTEADLIEHIRTRKEPFAAYVKRLIREDMERSKKE